jgi:hypothetical protein
MLGEQNEFDFSRATPYLSGSVLAISKSFINNRTGQFLATLLSVALVLSTASAQPTFRTIDHPSGVNGTKLYGISGDTIVGVYQDEAGNHGFYYSLASGTFVPLYDPFGGNGTTARAVDGSLILGNYSGGTFLYNLVTSTYTALDVPGTATGLSGNSVIGYFYGGSPSGHSGTLGFLYDTSAGTYATLDSGMGVGGHEGAPYFWTVPEGISGNSVVGYAGQSADFLYDVGTAHYTFYNSDLDGSCAYGISGSRIVGTSSRSAIYRAFLVDMASGQLSSLNDPLGSTTPFSIDGENVVGGYEDIGGSHGFIAIVPEPKPLALLLFGGAAALVIRKRLLFR